MWLFIDEWQAPSNWFCDCKAVFERMLVMQPYDHIPVKTVATLLAVSESSIWRLMKKGHNFPLPIKIGGKTYFIRAEIDAWYQELKNTRAR